MAEEATTQGGTGTATATATQGVATSQATDPAAATTAAAVLASPDSAAAAPAAPADKSAESQGGEQKQPAAPAPVVPDTYEFKAPEGATVDEGRLTEFRAAAKEAGLSQEQFQKLADYGFKQLGAAATAPVEAWNTLQNTWFDQIKSDPDLGGDKLDQSRGLAKEAVAKFGGEGLREALVATGAITHPAVFRAFVQIGRAIQDGSKLVTGKPASAATRDLSFEGTAARFYPGMVEAAGA